MHNNTITSVTVGTLIIGPRWCVHPWSQKYKISWVVMHRSTLWYSLEISRFCGCSDSNLVVLLLMLIWTS